MNQFSSGTGQGNTCGLTCKLKTCGTVQNVRFYFAENFHTHKEAEFFLFFLWMKPRNSHSNKNWDFNFKIIKARVLKQVGWQEMTSGESIHWWVDKQDAFIQELPFPFFTQCFCLEKPLDSDCSLLPLPSSHSPFLSQSPRNSAAPACPSKGAQGRMHKLLHRCGGALQTEFLGKHSHGMRWDTANPSAPPSTRSSQSGGTARIRALKVFPRGSPDSSSHLCSDTGKAAWSSPAGLSSKGCWMLTFLALSCPSRLLLSKPFLTELRGI